MKYREWQEKQRVRTRRDKARDLRRSRRKSPEPGNPFTFEDFLVAAGFVFAFPLSLVGLKFDFVLAFCSFAVGIAMMAFVCVPRMNRANRSERMFGEETICYGHSINGS